MPEPAGEYAPDLETLSTFRLPAHARKVISIDQPEQLAELAPTSESELILGGGSNTLFLSDYPGRILLDRLKGLRFESLDNDRVRVIAASGESWHGLVRRCLDEGLHGIENLALIPGSVGAAPIQNIGAYGVELEQVFESLKAWDRTQRCWVLFDRAACAFAYRDSRFKSQEPNRYFITEVRLTLTRRFRPSLGYASLNAALAKAGTPHPTPRQLVATILRLRRHRLPDPARLANAGSFFKNPILSAARATHVLAKTPDLPHWTLPNGDIKLAAGAMIERLGFKGHRVGAIGVYDHHALVLVNHGPGAAQDLRQLIKQITDTVQTRFGVDLEAEPRLIGWQASKKQPE